ncbi:MAG: glycine hydroxymethyltransferase, partial [Chlamydiae bacterium]|nr:glycine hydroxymethyltransferase [Chlamydiota bacterium]
MGYLERYFDRVEEKKRSKAVIASLAALDCIQEKAPVISEKIVQELRDQRSHLKLIASENYSSLAVQLAMGNWLTDKYAEGVPGRRFYAGCENVDRIEEFAADELKALFGCEHAYVQPHSGADANLVAYWAILIQRVQGKEVERLGHKNVDALSPEDYESLRKILCMQKIMGLSLNSG